MSKLVFVVFVMTILNGCSAVKFYNNAPLDAKTTFQVHNVEHIKRSNSYFEIYKLNSKNYAISSAKSLRKNALESLNHSIILTEKQHSELVTSLETIITHYNSSPVGEFDIIDYRLALNEVSTYISSSTSIVMGTAETEATRYDYHEVVLRIQFENTKKSFFSSGKALKLYFSGKSYYINIDDIKEIKADLER